MLTKIKLKSITSTSLESILDDVVTHHCRDPKFVRTPIIQEDTLRTLFQQGDVKEISSAIHILDWGDKPEAGIVHNQYIAIEQDIDVEIILRYNEFGHKTAIFIETDSDDDDYDNAVVYVTYMGSNTGVLMELFDLGISACNIESQIGDLRHPYIQLKPEYEYKPGVDLEQTGKVTYLHRFDKLPPDEHKLTSIETGETVTVTMNPDDPKTLKAQNGDLIDIDLD